MSFGSSKKVLWACRMKMSWLPILIFPVRALPVMLGETLKATVPFPMPEEPEVTEIQGSGDAAVQRQLLP